MCPRPFYFKALRPVLESLIETPRSVTSVPCPTLYTLTCASAVSFVHGLSSHALNGRQALVFGPEQNSRVAVRLVEVSPEVRASLGWGRGVEKAIKVENLQAFHA